MASFLQVRSENIQLMLLQNIKAMVLQIRTQLFGSARRVFATLLVAWFTLLAFFHLNPQIDIAVARSFFYYEACAAGTSVSVVCGHFPYSDDAPLVFLRELFFYLPAAVAIAMLILLIREIMIRSAPSIRRVRDYGIAISSMIVGPYILVNLFLKQVSDRPRPAQTDLFGGVMEFKPAAAFDGACTNNCSFLSGEAAGGGWLACLVILMPPHLRPVLGPPLVAIAMLPAAMRMSFGRHYLSDITLGFLLPIVVYAGITALFQMTQSVIKSHSPATL
ncbi:phosphatase PAP2 family protein [Pseudorhizobium halotolerans]|uniref:Phosphatase PAP2 family protein n=1 Tax=Pseudorhizobium halotolerans TaxID=1233081 RepID=A0ABN7JJ24_9HYPH|nr:phosphatase PAP2 family protein [Pseudorhizobium halotolerans]CAD7027656.1 phosphatase PAP2 family protein [Pseudorhizobium halotolerans]